MTAANDSAPSTSQIVVSRLAIPPRVNSSSMGSTPELLTNPVAMARKMASIDVATGPRDGSSTNAFTASHWVNGARMPAKSADPRMDRKGGNLSTAKTTSSSSGSRLTKPMLKAAASASRATSVLSTASGSAFSPRTRKMTRLMPSAGPAVQNMLRTCSPTVSPPPTSLGTRIVVSDSGVILSPK